MLYQLSYSRCNMAGFLRENLSAREADPFITAQVKMVEGGGFEPPKASPTDLQSVPFSHSGTPPEHGTDEKNLLFTSAVHLRAQHILLLSGAGDGTRTRNLLITNQLLYQLSYASGLNRSTVIASKAKINLFFNRNKILTKNGQAMLPFSGTFS